MANRDDILYALELFHKNRPKDIFDEINKSEAGVFAVIKYLCESSDGATSADICKRLKISSARMAVLIKRFEKKGLIVKINSDNDARVKVIKLSKKGVAFADELRARMYKTMGEIVDEFGLEELEDLFSKLKRMRSIIIENVPIKLEDDDD